MITAVDPGVRMQAWCVADDDGTVREVGVGTSEDALSRAFAGHTFVVEMPNRVHQLRPGRTGSTSGDVIRLACAAQDLLSRASVLGAAPAPVSPDAWKVGAKPPHHRKILQALSPAEWAVAGGPRVAAYVDTACRAIAVGRKAAYGAQFTHTLDAVGLCLWYMRRIDRSGNIIRL